MRVDLPYHPYSVFKGGPYVQNSCTYLERVAPGRVVRGIRDLL